MACVRIELNRRCYGCGVGEIEPTLKEAFRKTYCLSWASRKRPSRRREQQKQRLGEEIAWQLQGKVQVVPHHHRSAFIKQIYVSSCHLPSTVLGIRVRTEDSPARSCSEALLAFTVWQVKSKQDVNQTKGGLDDEYSSSNYGSKHLSAGYFPKNRWIITASIPGKYCWFNLSRKENWPAAQISNYPRSHN